MQRVETGNYLCQSFCLHIAPDRVPPYKTRPILTTFALSRLDQMLFDCKKQSPTLHSHIQEKSQKIGNFFFEHFSGNHIYMIGGADSAPPAFNRVKTFDPYHAHCSQITRGPKNCKKGTQRGPNFWQKGDPKGTLFDVKGDLKFEFFIIVHKERIC